MSDKVTTTEDGGMTIGPSIDDLDDTVETFVESGPNNQEDTPAGEDKPPEGEPEADETQEEGTEPETEETPEEVEMFDPEKFASEWMTSGELSEESRTELDGELAKRGIPTEMADIYFEGIKAIQTTRAAELYKAAGGQDNFTSLLEWGGQNLTEAEQDSFNAAVENAIVGGDATAAKMLIQGIKGQMGDSEPSYVGGQAKSGPSATPFANQSEMIEAMRDPRYSKDRAYVAQVQQRLAVSNF